MKRAFSVLLTLTVLCALLCACGAKRRGDIYSVTKYDSVFTVNVPNNTISDYKDTYYFDLQPRGTGYRLEIAYPNGALWWWESSGQGGYGGWSEEYDDTRYVPGDMLRDVLEEGPQQSVPGKSRNYPLAILLLILGAINAAAPRAVWFLSHGWRYKDAEPSDLALFVNRGIGVIALAAGVLMLIL